tara:strand:+ start:305 stop:475 length:171 start_codon:yes stop_codon:yes gene_type:complete
MVFFVQVSIWFCFSPANDLVSPRRLYESFKFAEPGQESKIINLLKVGSEIDRDVGQ